MKTKRIPLWLWQLTACVALVGAIAAFLILQSFVHAPYRPPFDMSPLLGVGDLEKVRYAQAFCAIVAIASVSTLAVTWRRVGRGSPRN